MPAAVHDLVDGVRGQLGSVKSVALGDLHHHLGVVIQVVGLLSKGVHFPHQDSCTTKRANHRHKGGRASQKVELMMSFRSSMGPRKEMILAQRTVGLHSFLVPGSSPVFLKI